MVIFLYPVRYLKTDLLAAFVLAMLMSVQEKFHSSVVNIISKIDKALRVITFLQINFVNVTLSNQTVRY